VLQLVGEHDGAVDATELAARMGLHLTTVRFHLDALCDEGVVGRNRLDYQSFTEILALDLGDDTEQRRRRPRKFSGGWASGPNWPRPAGGSA
jgi:predicted ArsR family transcriptional regulator